MVGLKDSQRLLIDGASRVNLMVTYRTCEENQETGSRVLCESGELDE